jgi:uncharacterized protein DUF6484
METREQASTERLDGVVIGVLLGFAADGVPLVIFPGNRAEAAVAARATCALGSGDIGRELALLFEGGDPLRPLVIGRVLRPGDAAARDPAPASQPPAVEVVRDGERIELTAEREIVLRCGKASIMLTRAGKVLIRGAYVSSHSTGANRIKGGSVNIN